MSKPDPIIDEIHRIREEHAAQFNYDLKKIAEDIERQAKQLLPNMKRVTLPPKRKDVKAVG